ncbi:hypothetical protein V2J09_002366 [Rumex salicifolius]
MRIFPILAVLFCLVAFGPTFSHAGQGPYALDIASDTEIVYFTDSSTRFGRQHGKVDDVQPT